MRAIITGGYGFIGSNFVRNHYKDFSHLVVLDNLSYGSNVKNLEGIPHTFIKGDIADAELVPRLIREFEPDVIVNFAAESHVDRSISDPITFLHSNVYGVVNILEAIRKAKQNVRLVQIGTDEEYGDALNRTFSEDDPLNPSSPYSASKASATLFVKAYVRTYGIDAVITRSSNNFGPYQFPEKLIPKTIIRALKGLSIPIYGSGEQRRDWIFVEDNCSAIMTVLKKGKKGEIYNISAKNERTNIEIVSAILKIMGKPESLIVHVEDRPGHDFRYSIDNKKIMELGWKPKWDFEKALEYTVKWYLDNRSWWEELIKDEKVLAETPWKY
ncbi:dTDP-glucose 4,6-dehydratase [Sulfolobus tengchongensis]|uniref:dTDP-glucose 4,6-dehydratase n=1 Tax=Sulfolobus tengchongensis TaxID=207809 RepID=A0AAX4KZR2_9CREN